MKKELATTNLPSPDIIEKVMMDGDLKGLTPDQRLSYYKSVCETLGLNPLTKPFDYIMLDGKLVLYARADCAAQLRKRYNISIKITSREVQDSIYVAVAHAAMTNVGREDESIGAVSIVARDKGGQYVHVQGTAMANAAMKAETKAKRRVTLSICGLGMLDESEIEDHTDYDQRVPAEIIERNVRQATANATGEILSTSIELPTGYNEWGPTVITGDNYKELKSHVGQAQGNLLGTKVGNLHPNVVNWLYDKWRDKLDPMSASEQDMRLKKAVELAHAAPQTVLESPEAPKPVPAASKVTEAAQAAIRDLRQRIQDLILTEELAIGYLKKGGVFADSWNKLEDAPEKILLYLSTPGGWNAFRDQVELESKPRVLPAVKKGRKK